MIRILVVSKQPDKDIFEDLGDEFEAFFCGSVMAATAIVEEINPRVVFVDDEVRGASDFLKWLKRETGSAAVILQKGPVSMDYFVWGADSTLSLPVSKIEIVRTLGTIGLSIVAADLDEEMNDRAEREWHGFWDISDGFVKKDDKTSPFPSRETVRPNVVSQEVVSIWGGQGGAGRTITALLLAEALGEFDVVLIDLCFREGPGDINMLLELPITPHIGRLVYEKYDRRKAFAECLIKPKQGRFAVIQPPPTIDQADNISPDDIVELIDQARRMFQIVIIDLPDDISPITLEAIDMSTTVLLTTTNHAGGMARLESLKAFIRNDITKLLVLNRFDDSIGRARDIAHFLDMPLAGAMPTIEGINAFINQGRILNLRDSVTDNAINDILKLIFGLDRGFVAPRKTFSGMLKLGWRA